MTKTKSSPTIHVVLDTNCLYTDAAEHLLSLNTKNTIRETSNIQDIKVIWHLPMTVRVERKTQMRRKALQLLPNVKKMERLLGISFVSDENYLLDRVEAAIARQIAELEIQEIALDHSAVEWKHIIECAELRVPPFEEQNEKGFRDALVIEAFFQLAKTLPISPTTARIVLVSNDIIVKEAVDRRVGNRKNIKVISDFDELWTIINALHSEVSETIVNDKIDKAKIMFFEKENNNCLYIKEKIYNTVMSKFSHQLFGAGTEGWKGTLKSIQIGQTSFISKTGQRMLWASKITFSTERVRTGVVNQRSLGQALSFLGSITSKDLVFGGAPQPGLYNAFSDGNTIDSSALYKNETKEIGRHIIECRWDVTLTTKGTLVSPKIQEVSHISSEWQQVDEMANRIAAGTLKLGLLNQ